MNWAAKVGRWGTAAMLAALLWGGPAAGQTVPADDPSAWDALVAQRAGAVEAGRWDRLVRQLRERAMTMTQARTCLEPIRQAAAQELPCEPLLVRLEEGLVKGVEPAVLAAVVGERLEALQTASTIVTASGYRTSGRAQRSLMTAVALALESGLSDATLRTVLSRGAGGQAERMRSIVEAGEGMILSGIAEDAVKQIMADFADRNMRRMEILRASRFAVQQHEAHIDAGRIRQQLWDKTGAGGRWSAGAPAPGAGGGAGAGAGGGDRAVSPSAVVAPGAGTPDTPRGGPGSHGENAPQPGSPQGPQGP